MTRATKDSSTITAWYEKRENKQPPKYVTNMTLTQRFQIYSSFMSNYSKMQMTLANFQAKLPILQKYLTQNKYWKNQNKQGQKSQFMEHFSFTKWTKLDEKERKEHTIEN